MNQHASARSGMQTRTPPNAQRFPAAYAGWYLKRERISRGIALNKAAAVLKVRERYIWAIEEGVDAEFPQASSFLDIVGRYADFLQFDPEPLIEHYREIMPAMSEAKRQGPGNVIALWPAMSLRSRPVVLATVTFLVAVFAASVWYNSDVVLQNGGTKLIAAKPPVFKKAIGTVAINPKGEVLVGKKTKLVQTDVSDPVTTASIRATLAKSTNDGIVRVRTSTLSQVLKHGFRPIPPHSLEAVQVELDAAVARDANNS